jgi:hypothetical protein
MNAVLKNPQVNPCHRCGCAGARHFSRAAFLSAKLPDLEIAIVRGKGQSPSPAKVTGFPRTPGNIFLCLRGPPSGRCGVDERERHKLQIWDAVERIPTGVLTEVISASETFYFMQGSDKNIVSEAKANCNLLSRGDLNFRGRSQASGDLNHTIDVWLINVSATSCKFGTRMERVPTAVLTVNAGSVLRLGWKTQIDPCVRLRGSGPLWLTLLSAKFPNLEIAIALGKGQSHRPAKVTAFPRTPRKYFSSWRQPSSGGESFLLRKLFVSCKDCVAGFHEEAICDGSNLEISRASPCEWAKAQ